GLGLLALAADPIGFAGAQTATSTAVDPGLRGGAAGAGGPLPGLTSQQLVQFASTKEAFAEVDDVAHGLGPRFNLDSCAGCHAQPAIGGSSPKVNPQVNFKNAANRIPTFITATGPVREVRFKNNPDGSPDGGVHDLFVITGRPDAGSCGIVQPDFGNTANISFRTPTPTFGNG